LKRIAIILSTIIFGLQLHSQLAHAEIYKWVDEKGTVHFADDPSTIPEKYRDNVKSRTTEEDSMTLEERTKANKQHKDQVKERLEKEQKAYEISIKEEEQRKTQKIKQKEIEDTRQEELLKAEKKEKDLKAEEAKKDQGPEYVEDSCYRCGGSGTIWKETQMLTKDASFGKPKWETQKIGTKCPDCNGKGFTMRRVR